MPKEILENLLKEYEKKKIRAELDLENRKKEIYEKIAELKDVEEELNNFAITTAKNILLNNQKSTNQLTEKVEELKKKRNKILEENHVDSSYLKPFYECNICKDTGYIHRENQKTEMCNCLKQKILNISFNKSNIANLDKENFNTFSENIFSDEVDIAKYKFNFSPRTNIKNIKNHCLKFIENFDNPDTKNLLFAGNTGLR